ncbi:hypothetical protein MMC28_007643 [Mycoblastus sanguinarius]|nr:hypothetical protein [Mycoblastus sanguinarius]
MSTIVTVVLESAGDKADEKFPVGVYGAIIEPYRMASANDLGEEDRKAVCKYGSKLDKIIELIKGTPKDDQVLVFVQFKDLMKPSFSAPTPPSYNPTRRFWNIHKDLRKDDAVAATPDVQEKRLRSAASRPIAEATSRLETAAAIRLFALKQAANARAKPRAKQRGLVHNSQSCCQ